MTDFPCNKESYNISPESTREYFDLLLKAEKEKRNAYSLGITSRIGMSEKKRRIDDVIAEKERIINDDLKQNIALKKTIATFLCRLLFVETALVFLFSFFQAIKWPSGFHLDEWSFKLLITATISQITIMLTIVVKYLFPQKK